MNEGYLLGPRKGFKAIPRYVELKNKIKAIP